MTGLFVVLQKVGDLQKAHVQAHFKRDPKTGKLIFIKDYDDTRHKHLVDKTFKAGHTVKITNPKSRHFGKMMEVTSYSDKYDTLRGKIVGSGETGDFRPHQVDHHDPAAAAAPATPPVAAPAPPAAKTPAKGLSLDDAKQELGLLGLSYTSAEMAHEKKRVESMDAAKLAARVSKVRSAQKLYNFLRAIREWGDASKFGVADEIEQSLVQKAKDAQAAKTGVVASPAAKSAEAAKPAPPPPEPKKPTDYFNDKAKAYEVSDDLARSLADQVGILPLDEKAAEYMTANIDKLKQKAKWVGGSGSGSGAGRTGPAPPPLWAKQTSRDIGYLFDERVMHHYHGSSIPTGMHKSNLFDQKPQDWENAGFDTKRVTEILDTSDKEIKLVAENVKTLETVWTANRLMYAGAKSLGTHPNAARDFNYSFGVTPDVFTVDTDILKVLENEKLLQKMVPLSWRQYEDLERNKKTFKRAEELLRSYANIPAGEPVTVRKVAAAQLAYMDDVTLMQKAASRVQNTEVGRAAEVLNSFGGTPSPVVMKERSDPKSYGNKDHKKILDNVVHGTGYDRYIYDSDVSLFEGSTSSAKLAVKKRVEERIGAYPALKKVIEADAVIRTDHQRNSAASESRAYVSRIIHQSIADSHIDGIELGMKFSRRKGELQDIELKFLAKMKRNAKKAAAPVGAKKPAMNPNVVKSMLRAVDDQTLAMVTKKVRDSWDNNLHGGFKPKIHGVYQIGGMDMYEQFQKNVAQKGNVRFMYHGTDFAAASNIVKTGFMIPKVAKAGRMLGDGVYMTPVASKSCQYLHAGNNVSRRHGEHGVLFVNKVVLGKNKSLSSYTEAAAARKAGHDSVGIGVKGSGGIKNEEHAIFDEKSVLPMYWVDIELADK